ncbi:MAG: virulence factor SrfB [Deltaproteobacteria bacterium]|jgi:hypothetical protein|nr:virulence factor SrfB [Deltaproteobacteria bacterium]
MSRNKSYSVIAGGAIQFIDFDIDLSVMRGNKPLAKSKMLFHVHQDDAPDSLNMLFPLMEAEENTGEYVDRIFQLPKTLHYEIEYLQALNCLQGQWMPLPFLVETGQWDDRLPRYGFGPTDWVRGYVTRLGAEDSLKFRLTLVFDPQVEQGEGNIEVDGAVIYHALSEKDVAGNSFFSLATHERDITWFIDSLPWNKEFLKKTWEDYKTKFPRKKISRVTEDFPDYGYDVAKGDWISTEYMAVYLTMLAAVDATDALRPVRVINPSRIKPIDVDLVIDIGNSRLTAVLVETVPQRPTKLNDCYSLQLRDISEPANIYAEPFDTKVEFSEPYFGSVEWSLKSRQHSDSFRWPSTVRLGPEANRLSANSREELGPTGMSSPKRYLWDTRQRDQEWHLNNYYEYRQSVEEPAVGIGTFLMSVNTAGVPISVLNKNISSAKRIPIPKVIKAGYSNEDDIPAFEARYSRSSLMMFLLSEVVAQALSCINDPLVRDSREHPDTPRRLQSIIMTVPTAMPLAEQNIFKTWARLAVETVWSSLNWEAYYQPDRAAHFQAADFRLNPSVRCDWDEATCTQVVWLYNEIYYKFHNNAVELFDLMGKKRRVKSKGRQVTDQPESSLRIASIDIGGGTSDLSITTYLIHNPGHSSPLIKPYQDFRDGFNVAGDDILRKVIQTHFNGSLVLAAKEHGVDDADSLIKTLFQDNAMMGAVSATREKEVLRSQFVVQFSVPIALHILKKYEDGDWEGLEQQLSIRVGDVLNLDPSKLSERYGKIISFIEEPLKRAGWADFNFLDFTFTVNLRDVDSSVTTIISKLLIDMGEIIRLLDCDVLILTGRPSRWPAIIRIPYERICLPVDRIFHMHKYRVGPGYPFLTHGRIEDPKTTVVVGAIICSLAEGSLEGITINTEDFIPQPINRYIGMLGATGQLEQAHVWFSNLEIETGAEVEKNLEINFNAPIAIGFRQLNCARWTTTRLYSLEYRNSDTQKTHKHLAPFSVVLEFTMDESDDEEQMEKKPAMIKRTEGHLRVASITDKQGKGHPPSLMIVRLQTLRNDNGYWLDTGDLENF